MKIIILSFDGSKNPSYLLHKEMIKDLNDSNVKYYILKSSYKKGESQIDKIINEENPNYTIIIGSAIERKCVNIERFALNYNDSSKKDSDGLIRKGVPVVVGADVAYMCEAPIDKISEVVRSVGLNVRISNNAGSYLCNHLYYYTIFKSKMLKTSNQTLLIHIPNIKEINKSSRISITELNEMIKAVVSYLNEYLR